MKMQMKLEKLNIGDDVVGASSLNDDHVAPTSFTFPPTVPPPNVSTPREFIDLNDDYHVDDY